MLAEGQTHRSVAIEVNRRYLLLVRVGVAVAFGFVLFRAVAGVWEATAGADDFSGYFLVLGQIKRQGWVLSVSVNSATLRPTGSISCSSDFSRSDEVRK